MAPGLPPALPARRIVHDATPANAVSAPRSTSSPIAKHPSPSKSLPLPLRVDRRAAWSWCRAFSRPARPGCRSTASLGLRWLEYLKVGCAHARTPCRAHIAKPAESAEAALALPPASVPAPAISAKDLPPHTPSRRRAVAYHSAHNGPSKRSESNLNATGRQLLSIAGADPPHPPDRREST